MKRTLKINILLLVVVCLMMAKPAVAQKVADGIGVDTLDLKQRIAIKTNAIDWALMLPNIGVEFDVRGTNWNRWTAGLSIRGNWQTKHTYKPGIVYNLFGIKAEVRNYFRLRQLSNRLRPHTRFRDKLFTVRRQEIKHPLTTYYKGAYASYSSYSIKFGPEGKQGSAFTLGFTIGMVKPLYFFPNGQTLDLDFGVAAGLAFAKSDTYRHDRVSNCYQVTEVGSMGIHPVISELRLGFIYRLGNYPVLKKYRFRYDVDLAFQDRMDSIAQEREKARTSKAYGDSLYKVLDKQFIHVYDSVMKSMAGAAKEANVGKAAAKTTGKAAAKTAGKAAKAEKTSKATKAAAEDKKTKKTKKNKKAGTPEPPGTPGTPGEPTTPEPPTSTGKEGEG